MSWLFLDTHRPDVMRVGWLVQAHSISVKTLTGRRFDLLWSFLSRTWFSHEKDLVGICVVAGPGSFSAVRIGVLYANLLARFFKKPLVGVLVRQAVFLPKLYRDLAQGIHPIVSYVAPVYDAEPNITMIKKSKHQIFTAKRDPPRTGVRSRTVRGTNHKQYSNLKNFNF